ncbi:MAG: nucleotidyltransferase domain-containing protein [Nitriliruptoraceae bacterium]|nr:nucleotidyltransferase domain-containing protein [Nitriliruptoraceae bacterium]
MHDPREGVTSEGTIRTGASRGRIVPAYAEVLRAAVDAVPGRASLYVYGSVATGTARAPSSDVDLLSLGLPDAAAARISATLSERFRDRCREVSVAPASVEELEAPTDEGYGLRVFLRHYGVHLAGDDPAEGLPTYPADAAAARGFNGDIARHLDAWRADLQRGADVAHLGTWIARKTLLAVAGLVSVRDATWSTDRRACAARWNELEPAVRVDTLVGWLDAPPQDEQQVAAVLEGPVADVVDAFAAQIGCWRDEGTAP